MPISNANTGCVVSVDYAFQFLRVYLRFSADYADSVFSDRSLLPSGGHDLVGDSLPVLLRVLEHRLLAYPHSLNFFQLFGGEIAAIFPVSGAAEIFAAGRNRSELGSFRLLQVCELFHR